MTTEKPCKWTKCSQCDNKVIKNPRHDELIIDGVVFYIGAGKSGKSDYCIAYYHAKEHDMDASDCFPELFSHK